MSQQEAQLLADFGALPPVRRSEVLRYIAFLRHEADEKAGAATPIADDDPPPSPLDIFGIWAGSEYNHITDSVEWVREQRRKHWDAGRYDKSR